MTCIALLSSCRMFPVEQVKGNAWKTPDPVNTADPAYFPEALYPELASKSDFGICFSGGGNRSATATLGQLRALRHTGILQRAKYISAVSGGAWGSGPYIFLQDTSPENEDLFLGKMIMPAKLKWEDLAGRPPKGSFAASTSNAKIPWGRLARRLGGDENFGQVLEHIYLEPHGLDGTHRIPVYGRREMERIRAMNPSLGKGDFLVCREGRPYWIAGSAVSRRDRPVWLPGKLYTPFEFTASYAGARTYKAAYPRWLPIFSAVGGGYVDNVIFDGVPREVSSGDGGRFTVAVDKFQPYPYFGANARLSLPDILGATGSAPTALLPVFSDVLGMPEFNHTPVAGLPDRSTRELLHTDGGAVENLGVMPLLSRGVKNLLVFYNTETPGDGAGPECGRVPSAIAYLFGKSFDKGIMKTRGEGLAKMNHVFDDPDGTHRCAMSEDFKKAIGSGKTMIHFGSYVTRENDHHGIKGGERVNVCWVVLGPAGFPKPQSSDAGSARSPSSQSDTLDLADTAWFHAIACKDLRKCLSEHPDLKNFPNYKTFFNNGADIIDLKSIQVNTLAHFAAYGVAVNASRIRSHLRLP